jgi:outer membrane protein TolC
MFTRLVVALFAFALASSQFRGAGTAAATDDAALIEAVRRAPEVAAASQRHEAARARLDAAGRLPDPEVEAMASRMVGPMDDRGTMWEVALRQPLPRRGERAAERDRAAAAEAMAAAELAVMAGELAAETAASIAESDGARARIRLLETHARRLEAVLGAVEARLASASGGRLADRLTIRSRSAALELAIESERRMAEDASADVRARLALPPATALPAYSAPSVDATTVDETALLRLASARAQEADAMQRTARASARPMTAVGLRFEHERNRMGDDNTLGIAFMSDLPWRAAGRARAEVRAAEAERNAAALDAAAMRRRFSAVLARVERAERLAEHARSLGAETLARLDAEYDAMLRSAGAATPSPGASTVLEIVELLEKATDVRMRIVDAETAARVARAELWRWSPPTLFNDPNP